ncbi:MAG: tetratricopeptide repeat protein, partial [Thermoanaerobaculia bacterium]
DQGADLDTRSDVYALGIVLYELLVGELPFGSKKESLLIALQRAAFEEPPAPSARLAELEPAVREAKAGERGLTPPALGRALRGDLDWIVLKAIAKKRSGRYVSAAELAEDIGRYRNDVPVVAGPPGRLYHTAKFIRRHLAGVVAVALIAVALVAGLTARTIEAARANREAARANREAEAARRYGAEADGVVRFLVDLFDVSDLGKPSGGTVTARELLEQGSEKVRREYPSQPLTRARLMDTMGVVYRKLGLYDEAEPFLGSSLEVREDLLGADHVDVATSLGNVATLYWHQGRYTEAEPLAERALAIREKTLGGEHPDVAASLDDLALVYRRLGKLDAAEPLFQRALKIREKAFGPEHRDVAVTLNGLAILYWNQGRYDDAVPHFQRALEIWEKTLGADHL